MGNDTVLAEALSEDQHDLLVSLMKVTMTIRASNEGPQYRFLKPLLSFCWCPNFMYTYHVLRPV